MRIQSSIGCKTEKIRVEADSKSGEMRIILAALLWADLSGD